MPKYEMEQFNKCGNSFSRRDFESTEDFLATVLSHLVRMTDNIDNKRFDESWTIKLKMNCKEKDNATS